MSPAASTVLTCAAGWAVLLAEADGLAVTPFGETLSALQPPAATLTTPAATKASERRTRPPGYRLQ
jgi:hypothetical protein